jgi:ribosomal protein S18 acetylase RimI-like enzyme
MPDGVELTIREARSVEFEEIADLTVAAYRTIEPDLGRYEARLRDVARRASVATVLVATEGDRIVGTATYVPGPGSSLAESDDPGDAGLRMLAVAPDAIGRGIGTALVEACLERAGADGFARMALLTSPSMVRARRIYERLDFERAPELDESPPDAILEGFVRQLT